MQRREPLFAAENPGSHASQAVCPFAFCAFPIGHVEQEAELLVAANVPSNMAGMLMIIRVCAVSFWTELANCFILSGAGDFLHHAAFGAADSTLRGLNLPLLQASRLERKMLVSNWTEHGCLILFWCKFSGITFRAAGGALCGLNLPLVAGFTAA